MIHYYLPFPHLRRTLKISEREVTKRCGLSRGAVRQVESPSTGNVTMSSLKQFASSLGRTVEVVLGADDLLSEYSTVATALKIERDGFDSWKIHLFNFVDEFRRTSDARLVMLPPPSSADRVVSALLASTVRALCEEMAIDSPPWATRRYFLPRPWFPAGMNSLKASAIVESPLPFRGNNIFVHENFLARA
jgi:transcriptional regulator with XRE-family HTH domain